MLRIAEIFPTGNILAPNEGLALEWYYMTYHKADWEKYVQSRKTLTNEPIKTLTKYFQSIFDQKKADGTLERQVMDRIRHRAQRHVAEERRKGTSALSSHYSGACQHHHSDCQADCN